MGTGPIISASFDVFPAPKGAATHIEAFAGALGRRYGAVDLLTVQNPSPEWEEESAFTLRRLQEQGVHHHALVCHGRDMIGRALMFRSRIGQWFQGRPRARVVHVRSIFEGFPIAQRKSSLCDYFVYECNGLPSIELKYHYAKVADDDELLAKLRFQEDVCLRAADLIVTPSALTAEHLFSRGVLPACVRVIPNGVDLEVFEFAPSQHPPQDVLQVLYCGTMTTWQGVHHALDALKLYLRDAPAFLTLVGPLKKKQARKMHEHIRDRDLADHVRVLEPVSQTELVKLHHQSDVVLVPLPANDRNCVQGCCPLKFLEAMATGTPVVVSDLVVTRALATADEHAVFVKPSSAKAIKDGLMRIANEEGLAQQLSASARAHVVERYQWSHAQRALIDAYEDMFQGVLSGKASITV
jgi:glycosyltransferase involved in cell wall biosynthesis